MIRPTHRKNQIFIDSWYRFREHLSGGGHHTPPDEIIRCDDHMEDIHHRYLAPLIEQTSSWAKMHDLLSPLSFYKLSNVFFNEAIIFICGTVRRDLLAYLPDYFASDYDDLDNPFYKKDLNYIDLATRYDFTDVNFLDRHPVRYKDTSPTTSAAEPCHHSYPGDVMDGVFVIQGKTVDVAQKLGNAYYGKAQYKIEEELEILGDNYTDIEALYVGEYQGCTIVIPPVDREVWIDGMHIDGKLEIEEVLSSCFADMDMLFYSEYETYALVVYHYTMQQKDYTALYIEGNAHEEVGTIPDKVPAEIKAEQGDYRRIAMIRNHYIKEYLGMGSTSSDAYACIKLQKIVKL